MIFPNEYSLSTHISANPSLEVTIIGCIGRSRKVNRIVTLDANYKFLNKSYREKLVCALFSGPLFCMPVELAISA